MKKSVLLFVLFVILFCLLLFVPLNPLFKYLVLILGIISALAALSFFIAPHHIASIDAANESSCYCHVATASIFGS